jgi:integrase
MQLTLLELQKWTRPATRKTPMKLDLPNLTQDTDRHGNPRFYVRITIKRRFQRRIRLKAAPGTPEFFVAYNKALDTLKAGGATLPAATSKNAAPQGSLGWLAAQYFASPLFLKKDVTSQRNRRRIIEDCLREPLEPGSKVILRDCPYLRVNANHIGMLVDRRADKPGAANNRHKYMSALFGWAILQRRFKVPSNPCRDVEKIKYASDGFHTWGREELDIYAKRYPLGTQAHLAVSLMLFLGARSDDARSLGPKNMKDGVMTYVPGKTKYKRLEASIKPILPPLAEAIRRTPRPIKGETFIVSSHGEPFSKKGFQNKVREWCNQAGLPLCTSHGLKKLGATICADMGATDRQLMALFDWTSAAQANTYTRKANRIKLAKECASFLGDVFVGAQNENKTAGAA